MHSFHHTDPGVVPADIVAKAFQLFFLIINFAVAACLNGIIAYSLLIKRRLVITGNTFVFSLTLSNFVDSFLSIPFLISSGATDDWSLGSASCKISAFMHLFVSLNSNLTLAMIAIDRYYAIVRPMKYHSEITASRTVHMLLLSWILSMIASIPPLWGWSEYVYHPSLFICSISWHLHPVYSGCIFMTMVFTPFVIMLVCYSYIYLAASLQHMATLSSDLDDPNLFSSSSVKIKQKLPWLVITYSNVKKARRTLVFILLSFALCWGIVLLWMVMEFAHINTDGALSFMAFFIHRTSAICYPLIYGFMNRSIRRRICRMLCKRRTQSNAITLNHDLNKSPNTLSASSTTASFFDYLPRKTPSSQYGIDSSDILKKLKPVDYSSVPSTPVSRGSASPLWTPRILTKHFGRSKSVPIRVTESKFLRVPSNKMNRRRTRDSPRRYGTLDSEKNNERAFQSLDEENNNLDSFDESDFELSDVESPDHSSPSQERKSVYFFPTSDNDLDLVLEVENGESGIKFVAS